MDYTIKALIHNADGRALLVKRKKSKKWSLSGGHPRGDESDEECLRRELWEELRLKKIFGIEFLCRWDCRASIYIVRGKLPEPLRAYDELQDARHFRYPMMCGLTPLTRHSLKKYSEYLEAMNRRSLIIG
ncbi:MAG: NUDIX domain-containing protein [Nanoarchaeota archaeon]